ncbi:hypothetical protein KY366_03120 [Candidatus Woesearchaeota archaeon]|nr:hypothetical protein [Candidatus Woesearchaeota archaeon]
MMKKLVLWALVAIFLFSFTLNAVDDTDMVVSVGNAVPSVIDVRVNIDDSPAEGFQVNKTGSIREVVVNATVDELNGLDQLEYVRAVIKGPSVVEESPLALVNMINLSPTRGVYNGSFVLDGNDLIGNYTVNVTVSDLLSLDWDSIVIGYDGDEGIIVYFNSPENNSLLKGELYLMDASTPSPGIVSAEFGLTWADSEDDQPFCNTTYQFNPLCENDTPSNEFTCLADFSQDYLLPMDTYICLRAQLFDSEGNNGTEYYIAEFDNIPPGDIGDLALSPTSLNGELQLSWTAPGDNGMTHLPVSDYIMKVSTYPITTEEEFNDAQDVEGSCNVITPASPGSTQSCIQDDGDFPGYAPNSSTVYYYSIKSVDNAGQNSSISNSPGSVAPYHDIRVDSISCVNAKNNYVCNDTTAENTNYLYDILNVSGDITNAGNLDETVNVDLELLGSSVVDSRQELIPMGQREVSGLEWEADQTGYQGLRLKTLNSWKDHKWFRVWSIKDYINLVWYSDTELPSYNEPANTDFYVAFWINNINPSADYYDIPIELKINTTFSIDSSGPGDCGTNTKCYIDVMMSQSGEVYHYWYVNGLPAGVYNVTVDAGEHPLDQTQLTRIVTVS